MTVYSVSILSNEMLNANQSCKHGSDSPVVNCSLYGDEWDASQGHWKPFIGTPMVSVSGGGDK